MTKDSTKMPVKKKATTHYVNSQELEREWVNWMKSDENDSWQVILTMVYKICFGAALRFSHEESEREELAHDAFVTTTGKIKEGKLKYVEGKGRAFNLVTTAVIRHMQSKKNREKAGRRVHERYIQKQMDSNDALRKIRNLHQRVGQYSPQAEVVPPGDHD